MEAFFALWDRLFLALAFGLGVLGVLARLLGLGRAWVFFLLAGVCLALGLYGVLK